MITVAKKVHPVDVEAQWKVESSPRPLMPHESAAHRICLFVATATAFAGLYFVLDEYGPGFNEHFRMAGYAFAVIATISFALIATLTSCCVVVRTTFTDADDGGADADTREAARARQDEECWLLRCCCSVCLLLAVAIILKVRHSLDERR